MWCGSGCCGGRGQGQQAQGAVEEQACGSCTSSVSDASVWLYFKLTAVILNSVEMVESVICENGKKLGGKGLNMLTVSAGPVERVKSAGSERVKACLPVSLQALEDAVKDLNTNLNKQLNEATLRSMASESNKLELLVTTQWVLPSRLLWTLKGRAKSLLCARCWIPVCTE